MNLRHQTKHFVSRPELSHQRNNSVAIIACFRAPDRPYYTAPTSIYNMRLRNISIIRSPLTTASKFIAGPVVLCALLIGAKTAWSQTNVYVDPAQSWIGYMNWTPVPTDAPGYGGSGGSAWGTAALDASFSAGVATFTPNTSISEDVSVTNMYWWNADGSGANEMDASFYVQNDALAGQTVTFSGYCW